MPDEEAAGLLKAIDIKLGALLAIEIQRLLIEDSNLAKPRPRSVDKMLSDVGLSNAQIGALLGKTRQGVGATLAKE